MNPLQTQEKKFPSGLSAQQTIERFGTKSAADKYTKGLTNTKSDRREQKCLGRLLEGLGESSSVLDLPCGTGRLIPFLISKGLHVTGADSSVHMVDNAKEYLSKQKVKVSDVDFLVADAFDTEFDNDSFDVVICSRLLHHFSTSQDRVAVLKELSRVSRNYLIVSFFCNQSIDAITFWLKHFIRHSKPVDRIPISYSTMCSEVRQAGLEIKKVAPVRPLVSKQWYLLLKKN